MSAAPTSSLPVPLKRPSEVWPKGLADLLPLLESTGFAPEVPETAANARFRDDPKSWARLSRPRSLTETQVEPGAFTYVSGDHRVTHPERWGWILVDRKSPDLARLKDGPTPTLIVRQADAALDLMLRHLAPSEWAGVSAPLPAGVVAEAGVVIGPDCVIGAGTVLETGVRLGARVRIGAGSRIGAHSRLSDDTVLGQECHLHHSVSIGNQGFGFVQYPGESHRRPRLHVGRVVIGDQVRLGAFVAIDRGVLEDTVIGSRSALDNIVQVGHNCRVGAEAIFCSFVGLAGSTDVGDRVTLAGLVGTKGHVSIGEGATVAAQSGINRDVAPGETVKGYPPRPLREALQIQTLVGRLPEFYARLRKLEGK